MTNFDSGLFYLNLFIDTANSYNLKFQMYQDGWTILQAGDFKYCFNQVTIEHLAEAVIHLRAWCINEQKRHNQSI